MTAIARHLGLAISVGVFVIVGMSVAVSATVPPPGFVLQETITVPTSPQGSSVTSTTNLLTGDSYKLRASGTFSVGSPCPFADAEYANFDAAGAGCPLEDITPADGTDLGVGVNSLPIGGAKSPTWGPYTTTHIYTIDFLGVVSVKWWKRTKRRIRPTFLAVDVC